MFQCFPLDLCIRVLQHCAIHALRFKKTKFAWERNQIPQNTQQDHALVKHSLAIFKLRGCILRQFSWGQWSHSSVRSESFLCPNIVFLAYASPCNRKFPWLCYLLDLETIETKHWQLNRHRYQNTCFACMCFWDVHD